MNHTLSLKQTGKDLNFLSGKSPFFSSMSGTPNTKASMALILGLFGHLYLWLRGKGIYVGTEVSSP